LAGQGYVISSAGTIGFSGGTISDLSREELAKRNIDGSKHRSQPLTIELVQRAERIYAMSSEHRTAVIDLVPAAADRVFMLDDQSPVADPIGGGPEEYQGCAEHIERAVDARLEEFLDEDLNW
jgi:protein-tyrosine-phosphatase